MAYILRVPSGMASSKKMIKGPVNEPTLFGVRGRSKKAEWWIERTWVVGKEFKVVLKSDTFTSRAEFMERAEESSWCRYFSVSGLDEAAVMRLMETRLRRIRSAILLFSTDRESRKPVRRRRTAIR